VHKRAVYGLSIALLLAVLLPSVTGTAYSPQDYTPQNTDVNSDINRPLKPSEIVELYPMSAEEIKAIVHVIPQCSVIVDGVLYEGKDITLFNGQRLHFTTDKKGNLYAFTDAVEMETFLEKEYGYTFELFSTSSKGMSKLFADWYFGYPYLYCSPEEEFLELSSIGFDDCISSAQICDNASVTLWDYANLTGDSYTMLPGSTYTVLALQGWNDRASSIS
jgi:hypothetical protein